MASSLFDQIASYMACIHTRHDGAMSHASFSGWKVKGQGHMGHFKFWPCPLSGFVLIWLNYFICGIHPTHEVMMCHAPFSGPKVKVTQVVSSFGHPYLTLYVTYIQHMRGQCVAHHFQHERSKVKGTQIIHRFYFFLSMASILFGGTVLISWYLLAKACCSY